MWCALIVLLAGCNSDNSVAVETGVVPTRTLVPATPTPESITLTSEPTDLPSPLTLVAATTPAGVDIVPAKAQHLIEMTMSDLVNEQAVDPADIRLLSLEAFTWENEAWGCQERYDEGHTRRVITQGYRILFSAEGRVYAYHTDDQDEFFLCEDQDWLALEGEPLPIDPVSRSMIDLTRRDAADRLAVPETQIRLVSLLIVNWPDSSLGCPKADGVYADQFTPGYRIVFRSRDTNFIYHTSIRDFVRCTSEEEILPGLLRQAMLTPTPEAD